MIKHSKYFKFILCLSVLILLVILHFHLIKNDPILSFDDEDLIFPLFKIHNLADYINGLKSGVILDFQPIRDLSFVFNIAILNWFNLSTFHLLNFVIFLLCIWQLFKLLKNLNVEMFNIYLIILVVSLHPVFNLSVAWISARKHLLALLFILLATRSFFESKSVTKTVWWFLLSLLSQPIHLLWPVALFIMQKLKKTQVKVNLLLITGTMSILFFVLNIVIYSKKSTIYESYLGNKLLNIYWSLGRAIIQLIYPWRFPATYYEGSILNIIGLFLLFIIFFYLIKKFQIKESIYKLGILYYCLIPTLVFFLYTPYLLMMVIIFFTYVLVTINKPWKILFTLYICLFSLIANFNLIPMWYSAKSLWQYSYQTEGGPRNGLWYAQKIVKDEPDEAFKIALYIHQNFDWKSAALPTLLGKSLHFSKSLSHDKKLQIFEQLNIADIWFKYFWAYTYIQDKQYIAGVTMLNSLFNNKQNFGNQRQFVLQEYNQICQKIPNLSCHKYSE